MYTLVFFVSFTVCILQAQSIFYPKLNQYFTNGNTGEAVFVTKYIENKEIEEGQKKTYIKPMKGNVTSYAGFFTVKVAKNYTSYIFFWFFPAESDPSAPVILWLQGGPGATSLYGVFEENGPFYVKQKRGLKLRKYSWTKTHNVLYLDNPVGTGFSFTTDDAGYARNEDNVANDLLTAVTQFFSLFPNLQKNDFFLTGESYAGKYIPALAYNIDKSNSMNNIRNGIKINLKGIAIGNGLCDPQNMMSYGKYLYQIGLIDSNGKQAFQAEEQGIIDLINKNQFELAFRKFDALLNGDMTPYKTLFYNLTGFTYYFNYRFSEENKSTGDFAKFIQSDLGRRSIHVGNETFHTDNKVELYLISDIMQSVKPKIEKLLQKKYKVLFYNGQLDIIVPYPETVEFIKTLNWPGAKKYNNAKRQIFRVDDHIAGYYKKVDNLIEVLVRDAGHMVPKDQPLWAFELITRFTHNTPL